MTTEAQGGKPPPILAWVALFNLFLALLGLAVMLWAFVQDRTVRGELARRLELKRACEQRTIVAPELLLVDETEKMPEDRPKAGYFGEMGTGIRPALRLTMEAIRSGRPPTTSLERLRLGSQEVLPSQTIHVVNLWATWCEPCRDEMPEFKVMFARRPDWGSAVRFVPILLKDPTDPGKAYRDIESIMPPAPVKLADREMGDPLATVLSADAERALYKGPLPVTLVLDCNRRVRWAQFHEIRGADLQDLERAIDRLRDELQDTSEGSRCMRPFAGNGRCDAGENTSNGHVLEDCGELKPRVSEGVPVPVAEVVAPPPVVCPDGSEATPEGRCKRKLRGNVVVKPLPEDTRPASCGNGVCDAGEGRDTCCDDCACEAPLVCRATGGAAKRCVVAGLRGG